MPRKINTGVGYEDYDDYDDYDDFEQYDYDYGCNAEDDVEAVESKTEEAEKPGIWNCFICTYDNDDSMLACDICGVIRQPLTDASDNTVCKYTEASIMAKSLFASLPLQKPKSAVLFQLHNDGVFTEKAPFKFDSPSPDDLVLNGLRSSKMGSKAKFGDLKPSKTSVTSDGGFDCFSIPADEKNQAMKYGVKIRGSGNSSDNSSNSMMKGRHGRIEETSFSKSIMIDIDSDNKRMDSSSASNSKRRNDNVYEIDGSSVIKSKPQSFTGSLSNMSLDDRSGNPSNANPRKATSNKLYKPENWMLQNEDGASLMQLNLAIVGHVDSGKSTLSGRLLHLSGQISQKQMHKYEKEANIQGKGSFAFAWALDESAEERERGITMTVGVAYFDSKRYHVVILDSPGHKDFIPNMISGATQADAAILVIDASVGSFEVGMDSLKGQTKEHAQLIRSFGVEQIIVAVNKMDVVGYSKDRFELIKQQVGVFLRSCGFKDSSISWLPLSVMGNQNLVSPPSDARFLSWYKGQHLLDAIDSFQPPLRDLAKPLLMPICDVVRSPSLSACGKLEAGALRSGLKVLVMPSGELGTIRTLERNSKACPVARAGDNVTVNLLGIDGTNIMAGGVLCHPDFPVYVAKHLEVKILVLDVATPILVGSQLEFHIHHSKEAARVVKILSLLDSKTGKVTKKAPRCLTSKQSAVLEVLLQEPVCVDEFSNCKALGRVFLRALGRTIAVGIVTRIIE